MESHRVKNLQKISGIYSWVEKRCQTYDHFQGIQGWIRQVYSLCYDMDRVGGQKTIPS